MAVTTVAHSIQDANATHQLHCLNALVSATVQRHTRTSVHWRYTAVADKLAAVLIKIFAIPKNV